MINKNDEKLHEYKDSRDWTESINLNFLSKKNKIYGSVQINFLFNEKKVKLDWIIVYNNKVFKHCDISGFDNKLNIKRIKTKAFDYNIISPLEKFTLSLKSADITAELILTGLCPVFFFPDNIIEEGDESAVMKNDWNKYEQRCRVTGDLAVKTGDLKGKKIKFDSFGQREHIWGNTGFKGIACSSHVIVQFRDMSMNLTYFEKNNITESNGFISKKSGNIPIINVECEVLTTGNKNEELVTTEFSYKDAQDDVDLLVGKPLYSFPVEIINKKKKFFRFINFSEFTIIGTNKKGYGFEEHYFSKDFLNSFTDSE